MKQSIQNHQAISLSYSIASLIAIHYFSVSVISYYESKNEKSGNKESKISSSSSSTEYFKYLRQFLFGEANTNAQRLKEQQFIGIRTTPDKIGVPRSWRDASKFVESCSYEALEVNSETLEVDVNKVQNRGDFIPELAENVSLLTVSGLDTVTPFFLLDDDFSKERLSKSKKINQDKAAVFVPYVTERTALFSLYDGHGSIGHLVSEFCVNEMGKCLQYQPQFFFNVPEAMRDAFIQVNDKLRYSLPHCPMFSGTTALVILLHENTLHVSNVGDSRAVLGQVVDSSFDFHHFDLTTDQKPDLPSERKRIEKHGGFVTTSSHPGNAARVWSYRQNFGLAMSRSLGDFSLKSHGVIPTPEVSTHYLNESSIQQGFLILASDGVWDFCSSKEAVSIVGNVMYKKKGTAEEACKELIKTCLQRWAVNSDDYRDDITAIVVRLKDVWKTL